MFTMLQKSAGADKDEIIESGMIDRLCYGKRVDNAETATEMR